MNLILLLEYLELLELMMGVINLITTLWHCIKKILIIIIKIQNMEHSKCEMLEPVLILMYLNVVSQVPDMFNILIL